MPTSTATKLLRAAALAATLVPLGSVPSEATSITRQFGGDPASGGVNTNTYDFSNLGSGGGGGPYQFILAFPNLFNFNAGNVGAADFVTPFNVTVSNIEQAPTALNPFIPQPIPGGTCLPIGNGGNCVAFHLTSAGEVLFPYTATVIWGVGAENGVNPYHLLHAPGENDNYIEDLTTGATSNSVTGVGNSFSNLTVTNGQQDVPTAPVPEPASIGLLATGLALLGRRVIKRRA